jgi:hypothetical protein
MIRQNKMVALFTLVGGILIVLILSASAVSVSVQAATSVLTAIGAPSMPTPTLNLKVIPTSTLAPAPSLSLAAPAATAPAEWLLAIIVVSIAALISLIMNLILGIRLFKATRRPDNSLVRYFPNPEISRLVEGRDPLGGLIKFLYWAKRKQGSISDARAATELLLDELYHQWGLELFGEFNDVIPFDPQIHRSHIQLRIGQRVRIVEPGWRLHGMIIKYPLVIPCEE